MFQFRFGYTRLELRKCPVKIPLGYKDLDVPFGCHLGEVVMRGDRVRLVTRLLFVQMG